jgi:hypothetical protein
MNRNLASTLALTTTAAAAFVLAALASSNAYADDITIDKTPFVSSRTPAEVRAEVMGQAEALRMANSEWPTQSDHASIPPSDFTSAQAKAEYIASRAEVNARNGEDSGSSYFAKLPRRVHNNIVAGTDR